MVSCVPYQNLPPPLEDLRLSSPFLSSGQWTAAQLEQQYPRVF